METSTTAGNDQQNSDATSDSTTAADSTQTATDTQTAQDGDNLDSSTSTDDTTAADGDTKPADEGTTDDKGQDGDSKSEDGKDAPAPQFDDDIDEWADKRGFPKPETDEQRAAYQTQRNEQREYTRTQQAKKDSDAFGDALEQAKKDAATTTDDDDDKDPLEKRLEAVEADRAYERTTRLQSEFYHENKVSSEEHSLMLDIFKEKVDRPNSDDGKRQALDFWGSPEALPDLLDLAKARLANGKDSSAVADEAAQAERERIAKESNATSTGRSATKSQTGTKTPEEQRTERLIGKYS